MGGFAGNFTTTGAFNTVLGNSALVSVTEGNSNIAVGHASLLAVTSGAANVAVGDSAGGSLVDGNLNVLIGDSAGAGYTGSETNNIILGPNPGVTGETNTIRIGGGEEQTACYIDGIYGEEVYFGTGLPAFVDDSGKL